MRLLVVLIGLLAYGQNPESSSWPPTAATDTDLLVLSNSAQTTLNGAINNSTLTVVLTSAAAFTTPLAIRIDNEFLKVCSKATNTLTICTGGRGFNGSSAASHSDGATVSAYYVAYNHNKLAAEIKALQGSGLWATAAFANDNRILRSDGALRGVQASGITVDDSDNVVTTGGVTAAFFSTGGSPPAAPTGGTAGVEVIGIGTAPTANCEVAGVVCHYGHSTGNAWKASYNGDTASQVARYSDALSSFVQSVPSEAYDATGWNGDAGPPQKDAVRDYLESLFPAGAVTAATGDSATGFFPSGTIEAARLPVGVTTHGFGASFDGGGSAIATNATAYMTTPIACTIAASNILVDTGTLTFKVWRAASGTAIPTSGGAINTSGIAISTGTALRTTTTTDYTDTTLDANDILAITLTAVSGATKANIFVECNP